MSVRLNGYLKIAKTLITQSIPELLNNLYKHRFWAWYFIQSESQPEWSFIIKLWQPFYWWLQFSKKCFVMSSADNFLFHDIKLIVYDWRYESWFLERNCPSWEFCLRGSLFRENELKFNSLFYPFVDRKFSCHNISAIRFWAGSSIQSETADVLQELSLIR